MVADIEELEQMDASETYAKRVNAKEVLTPMSGEKFIFPIADGTVQLSRGDQILRTSTLIQVAQTEEKNRRIFFNPTSRLIRGMMVMLGMISGPIQATFFTVITWNPESNCTCREKNHSLFR